MPPGLTPQSHKHNPSRPPELRGKESSTAHSYFPACKLHREFCKHGHLRVQGTCRKRHNAVTPKSSQSRSSRIEPLLKSTARRSRSPCSCSPGCWRLSCRLGKCKTGGARLQKQGWGRWLKARSKRWPLRTVGWENKIELIERTLQPWLTCHAPLSLPEVQPGAPHSESSIANTTLQVFCAELSRCSA